MQRKFKDNILMLIGRKNESQVLLDALNADEAQFVAVYGRRRVGKTFLIRETLRDHFVFQHSGVANSPKHIQLQAWQESLTEAGLPAEPLSNWMDAFAALKKLVKNSRKKKKVIFLDELPWMDTQASYFLPALEHFWNSWASARNDLMLVVCGSATSWIIRKVIQNHGGLHNRVTTKIHLRPFTLLECEEYTQYKHLNFTRKQITEAYMIMGGVPYYWSCLQSSLSMAQNIDSLFFSPEGKLCDEYSALYASLYKQPANYIRVIEALATKQTGLTRNEIISQTKLADNGALTHILQDLEYCGFIRQYHQISSRKNNAIFQLIDNYTIFYNHFILRNKKNDPAFWSHSLNTPMHNVWCGLSFERVVLQHVAQIKQALGISGVLTQEFAWKNQETQIDLLIDRQDDVVNLCEMKFYNDEIQDLANLNAELVRKREVFVRENNIKKAVYLTLISTYGVKTNNLLDIQNSVTIDQLFV